MKPYFKVDSETKTISAYKLRGLLEAFNELFGADFNVISSRSRVNSYKINAESKNVYISRKKDLFTKLVDEFDLPLVTSSGVIRGYKYSVMFTDEAGEIDLDISLEAPESNVEEVVEESDADVKVEEETATEVVSEAPDFEYAESLYDEEDKAASKVKLEDYARTFGVELSRRKTFENMLESFKEAV